MLILLNFVFLLAIRHSRKGNYYFGKIDFKIRNLNWKFKLLCKNTPQIKISIQLSIISNKNVPNLVKFWLKSHAKTIKTLNLHIV